MKIESGAHSARLKVAAARPATEGKGYSRDSPKPNPNGCGPLAAESSSALVNFFWTTERKQTEETGKAQKGKGTPPALHQTILVAADAILASIGAGSEHSSCGYESVWKQPKDTSPPLDT